MNMSKRFLTFLRAGLLSLPVLLSAACSKDADNGPSLLSVQVMQSEVVLPEGGTAGLAFRVLESDYAFQTDVNAPDCAVSLVTASNRSPEHVRLVRVERQAEAGTYFATLGGDNSGETIREDLHLRIRGADGNVVLSGQFTVRSEEKPVEPSYFDTGLPVVSINTEKPVTSKDEYVSGTFRIEGPDGLESVTCQVRGRGNTTWAWPKKPYLVKFDQKQSLFGMPKHKRWILLANFMDRTMMRNLVAMKVSSMTALDWTPRCQSVELVLNGKHVGNYLLIEQVRVDKDRVPVTEMKAQDIEGTAVTGGYLLELDFHFDNEIQWLNYHGKMAQWIQGTNQAVPFGLKYPDPEDVAPEQVSYIKDYVEQTASALYGADFQDPEKGYAAWLDVDSFIDYWIVFEVMGNHELGNPGSVYMHKDREGKLIAGPCWDFDWGVLSYKTSPHAKTGLVNGEAIWYARLFQDPAFKAKVKARYEELLPQFQTIPAYIDGLEKDLEKSAELNFKLWNPAQDASQNGGQIINGDENMTYHDAVRRLHDIFSERLEVIRRNL